jgi:hypothetical protein
VQSNDGIPGKHEGRRPHPEKRAAAPTSFFHQYLVYALPQFPDIKGLAYAGNLRLIQEVLGLGIQRITRDKDHPLLQGQGYFPQKDMNNANTVRGLSPWTIIVDERPY